VTSFGPTDWLAALEAEFAILATGTLGLSAVHVVARDVEPPRSMEGAYLGLVTPEGALQIGLAATTGGCDALARGLLAMGAEEALPAADVADAVCEIVNILAGAVKRCARENAGMQVSLGLPTFFHGTAQPTDRLGVAVTEVRMGELPAALLVLYPRARRAQET
jgi:hypothetical protein